MPRTYHDTSLSAEQRAKLLCEALTLEEKIAQMNHDAKGVERLGIAPYSWWSECLHGVARNGRATVFPQAINMAATFSPELIERVATAISDEARVKFRQCSAAGNHSRYTGLTFWTPTINIFRDPRWGRGQETYGEDPTLTARIGCAMVRGLQGPDREHLKVAACAKHYAAHSGPEFGRREFNARVTPRDLRDTYLPAFRALVRQGVEIVMGAYNLIEGEPCCASRRLLTDILRGEWGFDGHVTSDCWAIDSFHTDSKVTTDPVESAALAILAGCDLCCGEVYARLNDALQRGLLTEEDINRAFIRLARTWFRLGLFDPPEQQPWAKLPDSIINCDAHHQLARQTAAQSIVLLKHNPALLPLSGKEKVLYLVGPHAANVEVLLGNYFGASPRITTILQGLIQRAPASCAIEYKMGCTTAHPNNNPLDWVSYEASKADVCIAVMGLHPMLEGEEGDALMSNEGGDRDTLDLPAHQMRFLRKIKRCGARLIVLLTGGSPITCPELYDMADALLWIGYPGEAGGAAVADVLYGDTPPTGRLPMTWPRDERDLPPYYDYTMRGRTYRYMDKPALFPFGFGLSYTTFEYRGISADKTTLGPGEPLTVRVTVANTGQTAAEEVVQLYLRWHTNEVPTPNCALRDFCRVPLAPGESREITFTLDPEAFLLVDNDGQSVRPRCEVELIAAPHAPIACVTNLGAPKPVSTTITL